MNNQPCIVEIETDRQLSQPEISEEQIQDALSEMQTRRTFTEAWIERSFSSSHPWELDGLLHRLLNDPAADLKTLQDDARAMFARDMRSQAEIHVQADCY